MKAFIFARGGSKGVPKKNIRLIHGRPLIEWSISQALSVDDITEVIVSTDCDEVADVARSCGATTPFMRPAKFATDNASELDAWKHAIVSTREIFGQVPDPFISIPTTAPLRKKIDIENCIKAYKEDSVDLVVTCTVSHRSPWFNMVEMDINNNVSILMDGGQNVHRRQDAQKVYDLTTVAYVGNSHYLLDTNSLFSGKVKGVEVPYERSLDIDTEFDLVIAEKILTDTYRKNNV